MRLFAKRHNSFFRNYLNLSKQSSKMSYTERIPDKELAIKPLQISESKLDNGVTIITESSKFPSGINIGLLYNIGSRNENLKELGTLQAIKNSYLSPNEQENYIRLQLMGGKLQMDFDYEFSYFSGYCLAEDIIKMLNILYNIIYCEGKKINQQEDVKKRHEDF